jgi:hypothetical protein
MATDTLVLFDDLTQCTQPPRPQALCDCGATAPVNDGVLGLHVPKTEADGSSGCRYSLRTVTPGAALARDNVLNPAEQSVRDNVRNRLERGLTFTAPPGYSLPTDIANLLALADAKGWATVQEWEPPSDGYGYLLNLRVGRASDWHYDWCLFMTPDVAQETVYRRSHTPARPYLHITPPITAIRRAISKNPLPKGVDLPRVGSPHIWSIANAPSSWWLEVGGQET